MEFETILSLAGTLIMLIALQVVLGFDNLLYIALESKKAPLTNKLESKNWDWNCHYIQITSFVYTHKSNRLF